MVQKRTFAPKVHFCSISAPRGAHKHRPSTWNLKSAKSCEKSTGTQLFAFCAFWLPRIGKTLVHVSKSRVGDSRDDFWEIFSFSGNRVCGTAILIDVYEAFAKSQKVILRKIKSCEILLKSHQNRQGVIFTVIHMVSGAPKRSFSHFYQHLAFLRHKTPQVRFDRRVRGIWGVGGVKK